MQPARLRLELRTITVSLDAALRSVRDDAAPGARLRALTFLDRLEAKVQQARFDGSNDLPELDALVDDLATARLEIEGAGVERAGLDEASTPSVSPVEPD